MGKESFLFLFLVDITPNIITNPITPIIEYTYPTIKENPILIKIQLVNKTKTIETLYFLKYLFIKLVNINTFEISVVNIPK